MNREHVSAAQAKARFSELLSRVSVKHEQIVIERHGRPVAALVSYDDLNGLETGVPLDGAQGALAFQGIWADVMTDEDIDEFVAEIYRSREQDMGRPVDLEP